MVKWTIFTLVDLLLGVLMLDLMTTSVPPEKLARLRLVRNVALGLLALTALVLMLQVARRYGWIHP